MNKNNPTELVESWSSAPGRWNVMVVAPAEAPFVSPVLAMDEDRREASGRSAGRNEKPFEVIHVERAVDAAKLLLRGHIAVVLVDGSAAEPGFVEFLVTGLSKANPPQFLVFVEGEPSLLDTQGGIRLLSRDCPGGRVCEQVVRSAQDFDKGKTDVFAVDLLRAISGFPDQFWLRITGNEGKTADLCISGGRAVYCETGGAAGDAAARSLLGWGASRFEIREYPAFLRSNVDLRLADLTLMPLGKESTPVPKREVPEPKAEPRGGVPRNVWQMPPVSGEVAPPPLPQFHVPSTPRRVVTVFKAPDPANVPAQEPEIEEPSDIPVLAALMQEVKAERPEAGMDLEMAEEPEEPVFDPTVPEPEILVEEPRDLYFAETPVPSFDEPVLPDFAAAFATAPTEEAGLRSEVFDSFALVPMNKWVPETQYPENAEFDWKGLEDLFLHASDSSDRNRLGGLRRMMVMGETNVLVAAQVRNADRVLVVRTRDRFFGELEESELARLLEAVAVTAPTTSV